MRRLGSKFSGMILVLLAVSFVVSEVLLHFFAVSQHSTYSINHLVLLIALILGFVGLYMISPSKAKDGGQFIVDNTVRIVQVIRSGRRKDDPITAVITNDTGQHAAIEVPVIIPPDTDSDIPQRRAGDTYSSRREHDARD